MTPEMEERLRDRAAQASGYGHLDGLSGEQSPVVRRGKKAALAQLRREREQGLE